MRVFTLIFLLCHTVASAQTSFRMYYQDGLEIRDSLSADMYRDFRKGEKDVWHFTEYLKSGTRQAEGAVILNQGPVVYTGAYVRYYPNQQKQEELEYVQGRFSGERKTYYPDGKPAEISIWEKADEKDQGRFRTVLCYDRDGKITVENGTGFCTRYYPDGKIRESGYYLNGKADSVWVGYYPDGGKQFEEHYILGKLHQGVGVDTSGKSYSYTQREVAASYKGGDAALFRYIAQNMKYPKEAARANIRGKVYCRFQIGEEGEISRITVLSSPHPSLTQEAIRVLQSSSGNWIPSRHFGMPVKSTFQMPVTFWIE